MFLNFQLHKELQKYTGVDGTDLLRDVQVIKWLEERGYDHSGGFFLTWDRPTMGLNFSPYQAVQTATRGKRVMLGDRHAITNPFRWHSVVLNLPGNPDYDPRLPWIYKRRKDNLIAAGLHTYVDDN